MLFKGSREAQRDERGKGRSDAEGSCAHPGGQCETTHPWAGAVHPVCRRVSRLRTGHDCQGMTFSDTVNVDSTAEYSSHY